jgi:predicted porin
VTYISNNAGSDDSAAAVGAKYDFGKFALFGQYEWDKGLITDSMTGTLGQRNSGDGANVWMVGGTYTMGNNLLYAGYGQDDQAKTTDNTIAVPPAASQNVSVTQFKSWEVVGVHNFSKRTLAYLGYVGSAVDTSDVNNLGVYTLGMKHTF